MATIDQLPPTPEEPTESKLVSTLLTYGLYSYQWGKAVALAQAPGVEGPLKWVEEKTADYAALGLKQVNLTPDLVVAKLDDKTAEYVTSYELDSKYQKLKVDTAKQLLKLKGEDEMTAELASEIELQQLIADAREVAWERVTGLQNQASDRVDNLLNNAENYVERVLPAEEEEEDQAADSSKTDRARALSTKVTRRAKKKALAKLEGVTLQLRKSTTESPIVHLDLVRYSELLDLAAVRERVATVGASVQSTETYAVVKGYVVSASDKTEKITTELKSNVEVRVLTPAKEFYAVAVAEYIKRAKSAEDLIKLGSEEVQTRRQFVAKYIESVKAALGTSWDAKLYQPTLAFLAACEAEFAPFKKAYNEGMENPNVSTPDGKPYTIDAGLEAFVTALRLRLAEEWETRVLPSLEKLKSKAKGTATTTDDIFVDAQEAE